MLMTAYKLSTTTLSVLTYTWVRSVISPTYLDDDFEVGDVIKDVRDGQKAVYLGINGDDAYTILFFSPDREMFEVGTVGYLKYWSKTGKRYPQIDIALLTEILAELRGENVESSENPE